MDAFCAVVFPHSNRFESRITIFSMNVRRVTSTIVCSFFGVWLAACSNQPERKWVSDTSGISFRIPQDSHWKEIPGTSSGQKLALGRKDSRAMVIVNELSQKEPVNLDDKLVNTWEKRRREDSTRVKLSGQYFTFHGERAYKYDEEQDSHGHRLRTTTILCSHAGKVFSLVGIKMEDDPLQDT